MVGEDGLPLKTWPERRADLGQQAPGSQRLMEGGFREETDEDGAAEREESREETSQCDRKRKK